MKLMFAVTRLWEDPTAQLHPWDCYGRVVQGGGGGEGVLARFTDEKNNESRILKFHFPESRK